VTPALVSLVGAGPGDPDLITLRGARRLAEADLVLYDALVDPAALELAPRAQRFPVGKRAGRPSIRQEAIHALMIRAARRGRRVVRLKCGDPFVLGRGGEEALALAAAGVPFEVVPGLSSALAAPALGGVPLTHRGLASSFLVVSGHAESAWRPLLAALPRQATTLVVLMGLGARAPIGAALLERGWPSETPAAILLAAGTRAARSWRGSLRQLAGAAAPIEPRGLAGVIVVGAVVEVAETLAAAREAAPAEARAAAR
jgi:uroporphyrin-III C-methyltransferase / precorrin-2 dehydrogenase / sirohydrochlorin ferrochelatase